MIMTQKAKGCWMQIVKLGLRQVTLDLVVTKVLGSLPRKTLMNCESIFDSFYTFLCVFFAIENCLCSFFMLLISPLHGALRLAASLAAEEDMDICTNVLKHPEDGQGKEGDDDDDESEEMIFVSFPQVHSYSLFCLVHLHICNLHNNVLFTFCFWYKNIYWYFLHFLEFTRNADAAFAIFLNKFTIVNHDCWINDTGSII